MKQILRLVPVALLVGALAVLAAAGPISSQGAAATTSFAGEVDPTNPQWSGGMVACVSNCTAYAATNRAALKAALDYASTHAAKVYIPPGQYPIGGPLDLGGDSNLDVRGYNVTLRFTGDLANTDTTMVWIHNGSRLRFHGLRFSGRDISNATTNSNLVTIGDGGSTTTDDVQFDDVKWLEGVGGDFVRIDGGTSAYTVTRVSFLNGCTFDTSARAGIDVRTGVQRVNVIGDFFRADANRDVYFEDVADGPIGQFVIMENNFERAASATDVAVELSGHGGSNSNEFSRFLMNHVVMITGQTTGGGVVVAHGIGRAVISMNVVYVDRSTSTSTLDITGRAYDLTISDNVFERRSGASSAAVVHITASGGSSPDTVVVRGNRIYQYSGIAPGIDLSGATRFNVSENTITYHNATADSGATGFVGIYCSGAATSPCSGILERNQVRRDDQDIRASLDLSTKTTHDNTVVESRIAGTSGNALTIAFVADAGANAGSIVETSTATTIHFRANGSTVANVETLIAASNNIRVKTAGTGSNVLQTPADVFGATNLAGALQAGRPLAGIEVLKGASTTVGRLTLRDNWVSGARDSFYLDADGAAAWPEGYPIISGNQSISVAAEFEGGITTYRTETTGDTETVASGALSPSRHVAFLTTANTQAYTLPDGVVDGFQKCEKVKSTSGVPVGTLTPAHFADGVTHTITWTVAGGYACEAWDATGGTWRLTGSNNVTIN